MPNDTNFGKLSTIDFEKHATNGRLSIPASRLPFLPVIDTSLDLEITDIQGNEHLLSILSDFYPKDKELLLFTIPPLATNQNPTTNHNPTTNQNPTTNHNPTANHNPTSSHNPTANHTPIDACQIISIFLSCIDEAEFPAGVRSIFIAGEAGFDKGRYGFSDLVRIIARLTAFDGCEWDKVQTHESIAGNLIEEAYEAASAALAGDIDEMREEYGDCLLQPVLNCDIAARAGEFTLNDCIDELCKKLYTRHTHIFGADKAANADQALGFWEKAKEKEKNYSGAKARIAKLPSKLPPIMRAQKTIKALKKEIPQEKSQLIQDIIQSLTALNSNASGNQNQINSQEPSMQSELDTLLLKVIALYTLEGKDAESALIKSTASLIKSHETKTPKNLLDLLNP